MRNVAARHDNLYGKREEGVRYDSGYWAPTHAAVAAEELEQANLLREVIGNPFRPTAILPEWKTSTVLSLARGIYEEKAFDRMPILADALQDAGCANEAILNHCWDEKTPHVRGCWVVDLILGKD